MSDPAMDGALEHIGRIRQLMGHHSGGGADHEALASFRAMSNAAARAARDSECAGMMRAADRYALDLFSDSSHQNWATAETSGAGFLRQQILRLLDAFRDRVLHLQAAGHGWDEWDVCTKGQGRRS